MYQILFQICLLRGAFSWCLVHWGRWFVYCNEVFSFKRFENRKFWEFSWCPCTLHYPVEFWQESFKVTSCLGRFYCKTSHISAFTVWITIKWHCLLKQDRIVSCPFTGILCPEYEISFYFHFVPFFNLTYYHKNNKPLCVIICLETILLLMSSCILQSEAISCAFTEPDSLGLWVQYNQNNIPWQLCLRIHYSSQR